MGAVCQLAKKDEGRFLIGIRARLDGLVVNGSIEGGIPVLCYVEGESVLMRWKEVTLSSGSACSSASLEASYVLEALEVDEDIYGFYFIYVWCCQVYRLIARLSSQYAGLRS